MVALSIMKSRMLSDLGDYISRLWKSWWARVALLNGILSVSGRVIPGFNDLPFVPYIALAFLAAMIVLFLYAQFALFRQIKAELATAKQAGEQHLELAISRLHSVINEMIFNLDNVNHDPVMLRDEAFQAYEATPEPPLSPRTRKALHLHYNAIRALKAMIEGDLGGRTSDMGRRKELREWMWSAGNDALKEMKEIAFKPNMPKAPGA